MNIHGGGRRKRESQHPLTAELLSMVPPRKSYVISTIAGYSVAWLYGLKKQRHELDVHGLTSLANALGYDVVLVKRKDSEAA